MTLYRGLLLFDAPEPQIGKWENQLGYRGTKEVWKIPGTGRSIHIDWDDGYTDYCEEKRSEGEEPDDDAGWEVLVEDEDAGTIDYPFFGTFEQCDAAAKRFMDANPEGNNLSEAARRFDWHSMKHPL